MTVVLATSLLPLRYHTPVVSPLVTTHVEVFKVMWHDQHHLLTTASCDCLHWTKALCQFRAISTFLPSQSLHPSPLPQLLLEPILYQEVNTILSLPLHTLSPFPLPSLLPTILSLSPPGCKYASV